MSLRSPFTIFAAMKIFTGSQLKELDKYTIANEPIESINLMERAAVGICDVIRQRFDKKRRIIVFAGPGNNGGDALAVARLLTQRGRNVETFLFNIGSKISPDCETNKTRLTKIKPSRFTEITQQFDPPKLTSDDIIIDGLFGTGLNKPLNGGFASLVKYINASPAYVVSIDVPSGLMCEDNSFNIQSNIVKAQLTLTIGFHKLAFFLADMAPYAGEIQEIDIKLSKEYIANTPSAYSTSEEADIAKILKPRNKFGHKGTFGHALLVAGCYGMAGASVLAARACLKSGIGKLTVHCPRCNNNILQQVVPEAVLSPDSNDSYFTQPERSEPYQAVAIGPGLGSFRDTDIAFIEQIRHVSSPLVIDADGINILARHKGWVAQIPAKSILTPHPGEFSRLTDSKTDSYSALNNARQMAMHYQLYIVLKGHYTFICTPEGHTFINTTGNSGMATPGSGDVLTGILLALLAQGYEQEQACRFGVYLHGLAGDIAAGKLCEESLTASDITENLPFAFREMYSIRRRIAAGQE